MNTLYWKTDPANPDGGILEQAARLLARGGLVAFPTETVYGLGANALDAAAAARVYTAKGRPSDNPMIVHIADMAALSQVAAAVPEAALTLARAFWPGPLTLILPKRPCVPGIVTGGLDTVAVRMPSHPVALALISLAGVPVAAPSANASGRPSPTTASDVLEDLNGRIDAVLDGGDCAVGIESTVIDLTGDKPLILRPGAITPEDAAAVLPGTICAPHLLDKPPEGFIPKSPGMKYRHYAPAAKVTVFEGDPEPVRRAIADALAADVAQGISAGVIALSGADYPLAAHIVRFDGEQALARGLFYALRDLDRRGVSRIYCEPAGQSGLAFAVRNRLYKAAGYHVVTLESTPMEESESRKQQGDE